MRLHSKNLPNCDRYQFWNKSEFEFVCCANGSNGFFVVVGQFFSPDSTESFSVNPYQRHFGKWPKLNICCSATLFVRFDDLSSTTRRGDSSPCLPSRIKKEIWFLWIRTKWLILHICLHRSTSSFRVIVLFSFTTANSPADLKSTIRKWRAHPNHKIMHQHTFWKCLGAGTESRKRVLWQNRFRMISYCALKEESTLPVSPNQIQKCSIKRGSLTY